MRRLQAHQYALALVIAVLFTAPATAAHAAPATPSQGVDIYLFRRQGCPHCEKEIAFLRRLPAEHPAIRVRDFDIGESAVYRVLLAHVGRLLKADVSSLPIAVVGDRVFSGYLSDDTTGEQIKRRALACLAATCPDSVRALIIEGGGSAAYGAGYSCALPEMVSSKRPLTRSVAFTVTPARPVTRNNAAAAA